MIDADALIERMKAFLCAPEKCNNYGGVICRACPFDDAFNWIDAEPTVDAVPPEVVTHNCVPIKPLAEWLAGYAAAPGAVGTMHYDDIRADVKANAHLWEDFLRGMDWEADE